MCGDTAPAFFLHPNRQIAAGVAKQAVAGEGGFVHGLAVQAMHPLHRDAAPLKKGRDQQGGRKGAELSRDHLHLQREVTPQGGVAATHQPPTLNARQGQGRGQSPADLAHPLRGCIRRQGPGVSQQKQQRRRVPQPRRQGGGIPAQQQRAAMHRLGAGGVIVDDDDFGGGGHGTIVP